MLLTETEQEEVYNRLTASYSNCLSVTLTLREGRRISGIVSGLDKRRNLLKLDIRADWRLLAIGDVIAVEFD